MFQKRFTIGITTLGQRSTYLRFGVLLVLFATFSPVFAQQPTFDNNVIVRAVWWLTKLALYGAGAAITLWGVLLPVTKKVFAQGRHQEQGAVGTIGWGVLLLAAPSILQLALKWFNNDVDAAGSLDGIVIDLDGGS